MHRQLPIPNREVFPQEQLAQYRGCWVAFNATCTQILASGRTIALLEDSLKSQGIDPAQVWLEHVPDDEQDTYLGKPV